MNNLKNKKSYLALSTLFILIIGLFVSLTLSGKKQDIRNRALGSSQIKVSLIPSNIKMTKDGIQPVKIILTNTGSSPVEITTAGIEMNFTQQNLVISNLKCSNFTSAPINSIDDANGNMKLTCINIPQSGGTAIKLTVLSKEVKEIGSFTVALKTDSSAVSQVLVTRTNIPEAVSSLDLSDEGTGIVITLTGAKEASLKLKVRLPDVSANISSIPAENNTIGIYDVTVKKFITSMHVILNRVAGTTDYFETPSFPLIIDQSGTYFIGVKNKATVQRLYGGVKLTLDQLLDCTVDTNADCGQLISQRDTKLLLSGDSDGFDSTSGSYNTIDVLDLHRWVSGSLAADFNLDGQVNTADLGKLGKNFLQTGD